MVLHLEKQMKIFNKLKNYKQEINNLNTPYVYIYIYQ